MKIPKPVLLYLLSLEMLPLLDELQAGNSLRKAVRTIERFASETAETIEKHTELSSAINDDLVQGFHRYIEQIEM